MLKFWDKHIVGELASRMSEDLVLKYSLSEDNLKGLQYASKPGKFVGGKTTYVRIFNPSLLKNGVTLIKRYDDLATQVAAILFEGRIEGGRLFDIFDRRPATQA